MRRLAIVRERGGGLQAAHVLRPERDFASQCRVQRSNHALSVLRQSPADRYVIRCVVCAEECVGGPRLVDDRA